MIEDTKCYSGVVSSYFADHAGITIKVPEGKDRVFLLTSCMLEANNLFAGAADDKRSFAALRAGLTASVFMRGENPATAEIVAISPNYR